LLASSCRLRYRWAGVPSTRLSREDSINRFTADSNCRLCASWLGGIYAVYALEGLRGRDVSVAEWCLVAAVIGAMAFSEVRAAGKPIAARCAREILVLAAASLILCWPLGWHESWSLKMQALLIARAASWLLAGVTRLAAGSEPPQWHGRASVLLLFAVAAGSLWMYLTPALVGPIDARWYANVITDFLTQFRAGTFPVFSGETLYAFNGAVHPFRSAPWQFDLAAAVDIATGHSLAPVAVQHATVILSYVAATLGLYVGLVRLRPKAKAIAFCVALIYATSPGITACLVMHDMYMTMVGGPVLVAVLLFVVRAIEQPSARNYGWLGASCALLWLCHPPLALLGLMLAAFGILGHLATEGLTVRNIPAALVGAGIFAVLAAPYFVMTRGLSTGQIFHPFQDIVGPAAGLWLLACGLAQTLRRGKPSWLAMAIAGCACLYFFQPSLTPFAIAATIAAALLGFGSRGNLRLLIRQRPEPWLLCVAIIAGFLAESWFPRHSVVNAVVTTNYVRNSSADPGSYFLPLFHRSASQADQPGIAVWLLLASAFVFAWTARSSAAVLGLAAGVIIVIALGFIPQLSLFLWLNCPPEFVSVISVAYNLRLLPVLTPVIVIAAFLIAADREDTWGRTIGAIKLATLALLAWSLWEQGVMFQRATAYRISRQATDDFLSADNVLPQRYTWDLLTVPLYFSNGYMDPRLESRFFVPGPVRDSGTGPWIKPAIGPEEIARAMETRDQAPLDLMPTVDPRGAEWLYLAPKIILAPGERKLLRFDFLGHKLGGWLIVRGDHIYHEYPLPNSGTWWGFGSEAPDSTVLPVSNGGRDPVEVELVYFRSDTSQPVPSGPLMRVWVSIFEPSRAPISLEGLMPLRLRIDAPADGLLETFRSYYPGYQVQVDGQSVAPQSSYDGLLDIPVPKGRHDVVVKFTGTPTFRAAAGFQMVAWALVALAALTETLLALSRSSPRNRSRPAPAI
jgi:hypothetical protein